MPIWGQVSFQSPASYLIWETWKFHDHVMTILVLVLSFVAVPLVYLFFSKFTFRFGLECQITELGWTLIPAIILVFLAVPSIRLLFSSDELSNPKLSLKVVGHQWYWSYQYADLKNLMFDSYMSSSSNSTHFRLLDSDHHVVLPVNTEIRAMVTAADVIHAWAVPRLIIKMDAVPGRLNQVSTFITTPGVLYGQCSEICGANHSFMPITIEAISQESFLDWVKSVLGLQKDKIIFI